MSADGYRWWYVDAISDDGRHALTFIAFVGSVFSPYYAWARQRGATAAEAHPAINLALYGRPSRWCMTERDADSLSRAREQLVIGPSRVERHDDRLEVHVDEIGMPIPRRVRGRLDIALPDAFPPPRRIDAAGRHHWQPIAPRTRIEVRMSSPRLHWQGEAYVDANHGVVPLERTFDRWEWSRWHGADGSTDILYDVIEHAAAPVRRSYRIDAGGAFGELGETSRRETELPATRWWRIPRSLRMPPGARLVSVETLEDTPFYARSRCGIEHDGRRVECLQESLRLGRFDHPVTRCLLPFRMPRLGRGPAEPSALPCVGEPRR